MKEDFLDDVEFINNLDQRYGERGVWHYIWDMLITEWGLDWYDDW